MRKSPAEDRGRELDDARELFIATCCVVPIILSHGMHMTELDKNCLMAKVLPILLLRSFSLSISAAVAATAAVEEFPRPAELYS